MSTIKIGIVGYGNIGRFVLESLQEAPDFEIAGVVRRNADNKPSELADYAVVTDINQLGKIDVAILRSTISFCRCGKERRTKRNVNGSTL